MADEVNENIFLVNAPAGSGKTTWIRQQVESYLLRNPNSEKYIVEKHRDKKTIKTRLEQTYVMLMNFFAHCEKILRINLNPENWKDMKWDEIIDNQINEENKITCHLRNKIRSC